MIVYKFSFEQNLFHVLYIYQSLKNYLLCSMKGETVSTPLDKDGILTNMVKAHLTTIFFILTHSKPYDFLDTDECNNLFTKSITST